MNNLKSKLYDLLDSIDKLEPEIKKVEDLKPTFKNVIIKSEVRWFKVYMDGTKRTALNILKEIKK